jgi:metal-dependent amidase/aminoacylase/carboxypeptidase family protein
MDIHHRICDAIDRYRDTMVALSHAIHERPEPKFEERFAAEQLCSGAKARPSP